MKVEKLTGVIPPIMIALDQNMNTDTAGVKKIMDRAIDKGVSGLFILGGMGEGQYVTNATKKTMIEATVKAADNRVPVLSGISAESYCKIMENAKIAVDAGTDYAVLLPAYYHGFNDDDEVYAFFSQIADNLPVPMVIYNNPGMTGTEISLDVYQKLAAHKNIRGVKFSSPNTELLMDLLRTLGGREDFSILYGNEFMMDAGLRLGVDGIVPGGGTLLPHLFVELYNTSKTGDYEKMKQQQMHINDCLHAAYLAGNWAWVKGQKYALSALGLCQEYCAIANRDLTEAEKKSIRENLTKLGITD